MIEFKKQKTWDSTQVLGVLAQHFEERDCVALEGGCQPAHVASYLDAYRKDLPDFICSGTIHPKEVTYVIENAPKALKTLAMFSERCASVEICDHLYIFRDDVVLIDWHDAFSSSFYSEDTLEIGLAHKIALDLDCYLIFLPGPIQ